MRFVSGVSFALTVCLAIQSLFLQTGLLGTCLEQITQICKCNHASRHEKHADPEDQLFLASSSRTAKHASTSVSHSEKKKTKLAQCHTAKPGEVHACSCSQKKNRFAELQMQNQKWIHSDTSSFSPETWVSKIGLIPASFRLPKGEPLSLFRPPKPLS